MSAYFTLPSFARAKQNKEKLEKTNPQSPVLNDEDEKFLTRHMSSDNVAQAAQDAPVTKTTDSGVQREALQEEAEQVGGVKDQVVIPETKPETGEGAQDARRGGASETAEDPPEQVPDVHAGRDVAAAANTKKSKKSKGMDLPSQEEAEAATKGFGAGNADNAQTGDKAQGQQKTWVSYLPTVSTTAKKDQQPTADGAVGSKDDQDQQRTWTEYASTYVPASLPSVPSLPKSWLSKHPDATVEPVYNEDGTINQEETDKKQEREVSVLLDNLNLSSINNRVFAFSGDTQQIYERFALILKDTLAGAPTAYGDMDKLMRDAGPQLEKQFQAMPPFVQSLVKSLPAKLGTGLGPELLAMMSEKPGNDTSARVAAASKQKSSGDSSLAAAEAKDAKTTDADKKKKKRKITGLKELISQQGAVAGILRNVVTFLTTRFPFLASMTNVVLSLAVFILMFVFWYCHKRGKETRLAREAQAGETGDATAEGEDGDMEAEATDEGEAEEEGLAGADGVNAKSEPESGALQTEKAEAVSQDVGVAKESLPKPSEPPCTAASHEVKERPQVEAKRSIEVEADKKGTGARM